MTNKHALITGVNGQSGSYLAEHLLSLGYTVTGIKRRSSSPNDERIKHLYDNSAFLVETGDVTDLSYIYDVVRRVQPAELYNLAAQSHVKESFAQPITTSDIVYGGCLNCLEAIRQCSPHTKFYQASSSEMFGSSYSYMDKCDECGMVQHYDFQKTPVKSLWMSHCGLKDEKLIEERYQHWLEFGVIFDQPFQNEETPFLPNSPYAVAKLAAHNLVRVYRESYGIFGCCGILYNHESQRRGEAFVTRKISKYVGNLVKNGFHSSPHLHLGNLEAKRDWGHARDYVRGMHLMLQHDKPDDYVLATGETHSVAEFAEAAFACVGISDWKSYIAINDSLKRPLEVPYLKGDASKAKKVLGWHPTILFPELVLQMVEHDSKS